jgi:hypothetical protein
MNTPTNTARQYCQQIGNELDALEIILTAGSDMNSVITHTNYMAAIDELEAEADQNPYDIVGQYLNETILEFKILRTDDRNSHRIELLRTCGGPRCDITRDSNDGQIVSITTYDGSEQATIRDSYPALAQYLDDIAE